jgi:hypothetical protein
MRAGGRWNGRAPHRLQDDGDVDHIIGRQLPFTHTQRLTFAAGK